MVQFQKMAEFMSHDLIDTAVRHDGKVCIEAHVIPFRRKRAPAGFHKAYGDAWHRKLFFLDYFIDPM